MVSLAIILPPFLFFILPFFATLTSAFYFVQCWLPSQAGHLLVTGWPAEVWGLYPSSSANESFSLSHLWSLAYSWINHFAQGVAMGRIARWGVMESPRCCPEGSVSSVWSIWSEKRGEIVTQRGFKKLLLEQGHWTQTGRNRISSGPAYWVALPLGLMFNRWRPFVQSYHLFQRHGGSSWDDWKLVLGDLAPTFPTEDFSDSLTKWKALWTHMK